MRERPLPVVPCMFGLQSQSDWSDTCAVRCFGGSMLDDG
jgi:hypothetical protein